MKLTHLTWCQLSFQCQLWNTLSHRVKAERKLKFLQTEKTIWNKFSQILKNSNERCAFRIDIEHNCFTVDSDKDSTQFLQMPRDQLDDFQDHFRRLCDTKLSFHSTVKSTISAWSKLFYPFLLMNNTLSQLLKEKLINSTFSCWKTFIYSTFRFSSAELRILILSSKLASQ